MASSDEYGQARECGGYLPPPPPDRSESRAGQDLILGFGFARMARCSASSTPGLPQPLPAWQRRQCVCSACRPATIAGGVIADLPRSRGELIVENAFLRQQLIVASRGVKRTNFRRR
jgi:hypothetical protein